MATEDVKDGVVVPPSPTELPQQQQQQPPQRTKRKRWGERPATATTTTTTTITTTEGTTHVSNTNVLPQSTVSAVTTATTTSINSNDPKAKLLAMQESIRARLAAAKAAQQPPPVSQVPPITAVSNMNSSMTAAAASGLLKRPLPGMDAAIFSSSQQQAQERVVKKAKIYDVDLTVTAPTYNNNNNSITAVNDTLKQTIPTATSFTGKETAVAISKKTTKPSNPYLSHQSNQNTNHDNTIDADVDDTTDIDPRLVRTSKVRKRHKEFHFVEPGTYVELAATKRDKEMKAQASGYLSGRKMGHTIIAPSLASIVDSSENALMMMMNDGHIDDLQEDITTLPPRPEFDDPTTSMPLAMEWWDIELLPSKLKKEVAMAEQKLLLEQTTRKTKIKSTTTAATSDDATTDPTKPKTVKDEINDLRQRCYELASYSYSKTTTLVQHIVPIQPTHLVQAQQNQKPMVFHLTKKELKRQRKLRRQEQQREQQDLQAAGILPAPEPRLTLRNFIQVLGDQAYIDPSQIEQKVQEQMLARQRAHVQRNEMAKLTKEQRAAKLARKYEEDTTAAVTTAIFYVKDMSHPYHRTKVDLNAQQLNLSGCVLECTLDPSFACVIVEGGPKAIKRYTRLMTVRMKWTGPDDAIDDDDDEDDNQNALNGEDGHDDDVLHVTHKFNPKNVCHAVWQGLSIKRIFHGFIFQACQTQEQGRKIFKTKGVAHYWDQVLQYAMSFDQNPSSAAATLKLYKDYDDDDEVEENDVTMN